MIWPREKTVAAHYDACVIGAGADGLAAAIVLARAGLKTVIIERHERAGGRLATREFHRGFRASPFMDEVAPIPSEAFWSFGLARHGVIFSPAPNSIALWPDARHVFLRSDSELRADAMTSLRAAFVDRIIAEARAPQPRRPLFQRLPQDAPWPGEGLLECPLATRAAASPEDPRRQVHMAALAVVGRAADPTLAGSGLHALAPAMGASGVLPGGLETLAAALEAVARAAGAEMSTGLEVTDVLRQHGRTSGVRLADGSEIAADTVISTLDFKRTFLSLFQWNKLPPALVKRVNCFRMAGGTARLLLALSHPPEVPGAHARSPIFIAPDLADMAAAYSAWRGGTMPERLPIAIRVVSASDRSLAPVGCATMTVTLGCIPYRLFDGAWTHERRDLLVRRALAQIDAVIPGTSSRVVAAELVTPVDIEEQLGLTAGDLWGGEIASDQMLGSRPFPDMVSPRTPIAGLYLAGPSSALGPVATCAAGIAAAGAVISDRARGRRR